MYLACHIPLDSVSRGNTRALVKLKKTLLKFPVVQNTSGPQGQAALFLPAFVARRDYNSVRGDNQVAVQPDLQLRTFVQLHVAALEEEAGAGANACAGRGPDGSALAAANHRS